MQQRQTAGAKDFAAGGAGGIGLGEESFGFAPNQGSQSPDAGASATPASFNTIAGFGKKDVSTAASKFQQKVSLAGKENLSKSIGGLKAKVTVYNGKKFIQVDDDDERLEYYRMNARDAAKDVQQKINFLNKVGSLENERIKDLEALKKQTFQIADGQPVSPLSNDIVQQNQVAQITGQDVDQLINNQLISGIPRTNMKNLRKEIIQKTLSRLGLHLEPVIEQAQFKDAVEKPNMSKEMRKPITVMQHVSKGDYKFAGNRDEIHHERKNYEVVDTVSEGIELIVKIMFKGFGKEVTDFQQKLKKFGQAADYRHMMQNLKNHSNIGDGLLLHRNKQRLGV